MNDPHEANRRRWNEVTPVHVESDFYDVSGFVGGRDTLGRIEREAVGDVAGKRLLHLQCHFGMDTLSWVRLGAIAVGVDFSDVALIKALELAVQLGYEDRVSFVEADVTKAGKVEGGGFDIVFTSFGTIVWLSDLDGWAATVAANLAKDGVFYFLDSHPLAMIFDGDQVEPRMKYPYFHDDTPDIEPTGASDYADTSYRIHAEGHEFAWALQDIFGALERAGLTVFEMREYPFCGWRMFPDMELAADGYWYRKPGNPELPLLLGFKARW